MDVLKELGAYSALLEMNSNPGMQALGKRLGEIADVVAKEALSPRCWCLDDNGKSLCVQAPPEAKSTDERLAEHRSWARVSSQINLTPAPDAIDLVSAWAKARGLRLAGRGPTLEDWLELIAGSAKKPAPTPEAALVKEMAVWWSVHGSACNLGTLGGFAKRAYNLVNS